MAWWVPILAAIAAAAGAGAAGAAGAGAAGAAGAGAAGAAGAGAAGAAGAGGLLSKIAQFGVDQLTGGVTETGLSTRKRLQRAVALVGRFLPKDAPPSPSPPQIPFDPRRFAPGVESRQTRGYR